MAYLMCNRDFSDGAVSMDASVYLLFSANTVTGKSACSHPAQPVWGEVINKIAISSKIETQFSKGYLQYVPCPLSETGPRSLTCNYSYCILVNSIITFYNRVFCTVFRFVPKYRVCKHSLSSH